MGKGLVLLLVGAAAVSIWALVSLIRAVGFFELGVWLFIIFAVLVLVCLLVAVLAGRRESHG